MEKGINVLSLFDGMSCGQIALERAGIKVDNYFASEIDKYAIKVTKANYPETVHIGSVNDINYIDGYICSSIENYEVGYIDLLIGGSPCQNFSFAGSQKGMVTKDNLEILSLDQYLELKSSGFEFQGQSFLFWEYVRILKEAKPKYFLLENVKMAKKWSDLISSIMGVEPVLINSALVSAQNRQRLYWTNIPEINQPIDKGILLKDIVEGYIIEFPEKFKQLLKEGDIKSEQNLTGESQTLDRAVKNKGNSEGKTNSLTACAFKGMGTNGMTNVLIYDTDREKSLSLTTRVNGATADRYIKKSMHQMIKVTNVNPSGNGMNGNVFSIEGKSPTLTTNKGEGLKITSVQNDNTVIYHDNKIQEYRGLFYRKLTPKECERLQTVPDNYTNHVSNTQRYKMLGNGWTVDVIAHIFKNL